MGDKLSEHILQGILGQSLGVLGGPWEVSREVSQALGGAWWFIGSFLGIPGESLGWSWVFLGVLWGVTGDANMSPGLVSHHFAGQ